MRTIKEALEDGSLSLEDEIDYADMTEEEYKKEIEKLNNIINELEKEFDKTIKDPLIHMCYKRISREYSDKLQELKGSGK